MRTALMARVLLERLSGKSIFAASYYRESQLTRLMNLFAHVDLERWRDYKILEVGSGRGDLGAAFTQLGFDVTSTDGRPEHVAAIKAMGRKTFVLDLDSTGVDTVGDYDLILSFGVLYHLARPEEFLRSCGKRAKVLLLETAVCDRSEPIVRWIDEPGGWRGTDQALEGKACRPSPSWVEGVCREAGFSSVRDISSGLGNWKIGSFDWTPRDTGEWRRDGVNLRKMWVCERDA
jgi:SAM-dependent methyltransferase